MSVEQRAAAIALALADLGLRPLVIGGHAVRFHGVDRSTIDYDFCLAVDLSGWRDLAATLQRSPVIAGAGFREGTSWRPGSFKRFVLGALPDGREERLEFWRRNHLLAPFEELYARRSEGLYGGGRLAFIGLDDLIRSKETEREDDWRDVGLLEEIADERKLAAADSSDGRLQALRALRSRRGFDRALSTGLLGDSQAVRAALAAATNPISRAYLLPSAGSAPADALPDEFLGDLASALATVAPGSARHLALVEAARRLHRRAAMAADRADKEREASGGSEP